MDKKGLYNFPQIDVQLKGAENYTAWALTMQYNLRAFGVWGYVQGKLKCPSDDAATSSSTSSSDTTTSSSAKLTRDQWIRTDEQIMAYIVRSVSVPIHLSIGRLTSSKDSGLPLAACLYNLE